jgi:hypothetical protein
MEEFGYYCSNIGISLTTVLTLYRDRSTIVVVKVLPNFFPFSDIFCHARGQRLLRGPSGWTCLTGEALGKDSGEKVCENERTYN